MSLALTAVEIHSDAYRFFYQNPLNYMDPHSEITFPFRRLFLLQLFEVGFAEIPNAH